MTRFLSRLQKYTEALKKWEDGQKGNNEPCPADFGIIKPSELRLVQVRRDEVINRKRIK